MSQSGNRGNLFLLILLNVAIGISWIAYHHFQPILLGYFGLESLSDEMFYVQWLILGLVPVLAGRLSDWMWKRKDRYFAVYLTGVGAAAMTFMAVAAWSGVEALLAYASLVPAFIVVWLISMNMFHAPANALLKHMGEDRHLPGLMAFLVIGTEGIYALEPVFVPIMATVGTVNIFITGGIAIAVTGWLFHRRWRVNPPDFVEYDQQKGNDWWKVIVASVAFGSLFGFITGILPDVLNSMEIRGDRTTALLIAAISVLAFPAVRLVRNMNLNDVNVFSWVAGAISVVILLMSSAPWMAYAGTFLLAVSLGILSVSSFPTVLINIRKDRLATGAGIFIGAAEAFEGFWIYLYY